MKRFWIAALALFLAFALFGCAKTESTYTVTKNGTTYRVDTQKQAIYDTLYTYQYQLSGNSSSFSITITYPNNSTYWYSKSDGRGQGGWSDDYSEAVYAPGDTLVAVMQETMSKPANVGGIFGGLLLIAVGILNLVAPQALWYLGYGWRFKNAEPSEAAISFGRISGAIVIIIGIVFLFV